MTRHKYLPSHLLPPYRDNIKTAIPNLQIRTTGFNIIKLNQMAIKKITLPVKSTVSLTRSVGHSGHSNLLVPIAQFKCRYPLFVPVPYMKRSINIIPIKIDDYTKFLFPIDQMVSLEIFVFVAYTVVFGDPNVPPATFIFLIALSGTYVFALAIDLISQYSGGESNALTVIICISNIPARNIFQSILVHVFITGVPLFLIRHDILRDRRDFSTISLHCFWSLVHIIDTVSLFSNVHPLHDSCRDCTDVSL